MKTQIAGPNGRVESAMTRHPILLKVLLTCGIISSLIYASMDVIGGTRWQNYNWLSNEFSRLSAIGAPSRSIHLAINPFYIISVIAFGLGVWWSAGRKRGLRVIGGALIVYALVSYVWPQFFPEDLTQPVSAFTNTMHIILTFITVLTWILILGFATTIFGKRFRYYSIGTLLAVIGFGALTGPQATALAAGEPTPWIGFTERLNIYSFMIWVVVLAIALFRVQSDSLALEKGE